MSSESVVLKFWYDFSLLRTAYADDKIALGTIHQPQKGLQMRIPEQLWSLGLQVAHGPKAFTVFTAVLFAEHPRIISFVAHQHSLLGEVIIQS